MHWEDLSFMELFPWPRDPGLRNLLMEQPRAGRLGASLYGNYPPVLFLVKLWGGILVQNAELCTCSSNSCPLFIFFFVMVLRVYKTVFEIPVSYVIRQVQLLESDNAKRASKTQPDFTSHLNWTLNTSPYQ